MVWHVDPQVHFSGVFEGGIGHELLHIAVHVMDAGDAGCIEFLDGQLQQLALAAGVRLGDAVQNRLHGVVFAQFACGYTIRIADDKPILHFMLIFMENPRHLQGRCVRPGRVTVIGADVDRTVGQDLVQLLPGGDNVIADAASQNPG